MKNGKFALGIVGLSNRGCDLGKNFFEKLGNCYVTCVCDINEALVDKAVDMFGDNVTGYNNIDDFLKHDELDMVLIASADKSHKECAVKTLKAKKHLYLEKPMAQTIEDCDAIINAWYNSGCVFMVGLELRYCTLMQDCKKLIDNDEIGKIIMANVVDNVSVGGNYYFHGPKRKKEYVKSLILEKGTHSLDLANWLIGASPKKVYASGGLNVFGGSESKEKRCCNCDQAKNCKYEMPKQGFLVDFGAPEDNFPDGCVYSSECDVPDNSIVLVDYDNGARMSYMECHFTPEYTREFTFIGTKGKLTAFYDNEQNFKIMVHKRFEDTPVYYYPKKLNDNASHGGGDYGIVKEFFERVNANVPCMHGIKGARDSAAIAIAAYESEITGMPVDIPDVDYPDNMKN